MLNWWCITWPVGFRRLKTKCYRDNIQANRKYIPYEWNKCTNTYHLQKVVVKNGRVQQGQNLEETSLNECEILPHKHGHNTEPFTYIIIFPIQTCIRRGGITYYGTGDRCASGTVTDTDPFWTGGDIIVPVDMLTAFWSTLLHPYTRFSSEAWRRLLQGVSAVWQHSSQHSLYLLGSIS